MNKQVEKDNSWPCTQKEMVRDLAILIVVVLFLVSIIIK